MTKPRISAKNRVLINEAKCKIMALNKQQDVIYDALLADLGIEHESEKETELFEYVFNECSVKLIEVLNLNEEN